MEYRHLLREENAPRLFCPGQPEYVRSIPKVLGTVCYQVTMFCCSAYFFVIPFYLQSLLVHSANCVKTYTVACRRVISAPLQLIGSRPLVAFGNEIN
jgi:hypothetical protein